MCVATILVLCAYLVIKFLPYNIVCPIGARYGIGGDFFVNGVEKYRYTSNKS